MNPTDSASAPRPQRWLILAHAFNMDGRAASQTITDKLPHLRAAGIEVVVLSGVSGRKDQVVEHHQLWPAGPAGIRFELRHVLRKRLHGLSYRAVMTLASIVLLPGLVIEKLLRPVESSWSWWLSAYLTGRRLMRARHFDLIYSTGGAFAAHMAGRALKRSTGVRWLAEVHDPFLVPGTQPSTAQHRMQLKVEAMICREADVAVWFTDQALASAKARHPALGDRGHVMLPGIDNPFHEALPPYAPGPVFVLGHFGSLSPTRNLTPIINALERLFDAEPKWRGQVELHVYGGPLDAVSAEQLAASPAKDAVRHFGRVEADPHTGESGRSQILRRMRACDALLLLHGQEPICAEYIPSKLYEYLWIQRPILATVHGNPQMAQVLTAEGHEVVQSERLAPPAIALALSHALAALISTWARTGLVDSGRMSPYTTAASVTQLVGWAMPREAQ